MFEFLPVENSDIEILSDIAIRSKAWWGYDDRLMKLFSALPILTPEKIKQEKVIKACLDGIIIGWYLYAPIEEGVELREFWMSPEYIGKGFGGKMFQDLKKSVKSDGYNCIIFDADPNAAAFYEHMGCRIIGQTLSEWNRFIPKMSIEF